jgi:hypothetical protein
VKYPVVLAKIGVTIAQEKVGPTTASLHLRIDMARENASSMWSETVSSLLLAAEDKDWTVDVSKQFFASDGAVRYLWRFVFRGNVQEGLATLAQCALTALQATVTPLTSYPLVGRAEYELDPLRGKLKGGHGVDTAPSYVALHAVGG